jgi:hypothetical protein
MAESSACSGDKLFTVRHRRTAKGGTNPRENRRGGEAAGRFDNGTLAMSPARFDRIQPRTFDGQALRHKAHTAVSRDLPVMHPTPRPDLLAAMPGGLVPHAYEDPFPLGGEPLAEPGEQGRRDVTHGTAVDIPQQDRVGVRA